MLIKAAGVLGAGYRTLSGYRLVCNRGPDPRRRRACSAAGDTQPRRRPPGASVVALGTFVKKRAKPMLPLLPLWNGITKYAFSPMA
jgi:hypothetical protein